MCCKCFDCSFRFYRVPDTNNNRRWRISRRVESLARFIFYSFWFSSFGRIILFYGPASINFVLHDFGFSIFFIKYFRSSFYRKFVFIKLFFYFFYLKAFLRNSLLWENKPYFFSFFGFFDLFLCLYQTLYGFKLYCLFYGYNHV